MMKHFNLSILLVVLSFAVFVAAGCNGSNEQTETDNQTSALNALITELRQANNTLRTEIEAAIVIKVKAETIAEAEVIAEAKARAEAEVIAEAKARAERMKRIYASLIEDAKNSVKEPPKQPFK